MREFPDARPPLLESWRLPGDGGVGIRDRVEEAGSVKIALRVDGASRRNSWILVGVDFYVAPAVKPRRSVGFYMVVRRR